MTTLRKGKAIWKLSDDFFSAVILSTVTTSTCNTERDLFTTKAEKHVIDANAVCQQFLENRMKKHTIIVENQRRTTHKSSIVEANNQNEMLRIQLCSALFSLIYIEDITLHEAFSFNWQFVCFICRLLHSKYFTINYSKWKRYKMGRILFVNIFRWMQQSHTQWAPTNFDSRLR